MRRLLLTMIASMGVMVAGCSGGASGPEDHQAWALGDGAVSQQEYHTAVDSFITCMRTAGFTVTKPVLSPIDGLTLLYDIVPSGEPAVWNETLESCNQRHLSHIEPAYVESAPHVMQPLLRKAVAKCLARQGVSTKGSESNATEFVAATGNRSLLVMKCVTTTARTLFPELPHRLRVLY